MVRMFAICNGEDIQERGEREGGEAYGRVIVHVNM